LTIPPNGFRDERGAIVVEFAIISTLLLVLVFGIIEFGLTFSRYEVYLNAAREGARKGAVRADKGAILDSVANAGADYPMPARDQISITVDNGPTGDPPCDDATVGHDLKVGWRQVFKIQIPLLPDLNPSVQIEGVFRCE
jgi:TadE-like protein